MSKCTDLVPSCLGDGEIVLDKAHSVGMTATEDFLSQTFDLVHVLLMVFQILLKFLHKLHTHEHFGHLWGCKYCS